MHRLRVRENNGQDDFCLVGIPMRHRKPLVLTGIICTSCVIAHKGQRFEWQVLIPDVGNSGTAAATTRRRHDPVPPRSGIIT